MASRAKFRACMRRKLKGKHGSRRAFAAAARKCARGK